MSAVSEWIVREYFESLGFLVREPVKYQVAARKKLAEEELDLVVLNPKVKEQKLPEHVLWSAKDLDGVAQAVVGVRGWHTDRFSPARMSLAPEVFRFAEEDVVQKAAHMLGPGPVAKILCLPGLPTGGTLREKSLVMLKERGIDGVIPFRTMLLELAAHVQKSKNYDKSDLLQIIRIMKNYDLLKDPQMELFGGRKRRRKKTDNH
ncbi:MAG: hypothetical protein JXB04_02695 [Kiritimatiellae bacterium]|nr:hypothetical protein [Kiritimatiellia bacterium]